MNLARAVHVDESDTFVFDRPARTGEWCIPGGFEFSNHEEDELTGKVKQAFSNGWLGLETFGRVTLVAVTRIEPEEYEQLVDMLAQYFVTFYGAPDVGTARPVAEEELAEMADLCDEHEPNTLLTVSRELTLAGVREAFRVIRPQEAELEQFAVHVTPNS